VTPSLSDLGLPDSAVLAVDDAGASLTHGEVVEGARAWADTLGSDKRLVLLLCRNTCACLRAYLGLLRAGHAVILAGEDAGEAALADLKARFRPHAVVDASGEVRSLEPDGAPVNPALGVLLSTSGSTGSAKLARFSLAQLEANARSIAAYLELAAAERPLAHLPFHYSYGLSVLHSHLLVGATVLLSEASVMNPGFWTRLQDATSLSGVPFHYEMLLKLRFQRRDLPKLRTLTQAGGRLAPALVSQLAGLADEKGWRFFVMYGQTEAGPRISYASTAMLKDKPETIGGPIPGVTMTLIDEAGAEISQADREGELVVESPSIMLGYAESASDLMRGDDLSGRLATGDLAVRDAEGRFTVTGRKNRFLKLQGNRVNLAEVESRLAALGFSAVCVGEDDRLWLATESDDEAALREAVVREFTFPSRSATVVRMARLPRSDSGKPRYRELLAQLKDGQEAQPR